MADLVVGSRIKALVKESNMICSGGLVDAVDKAVAELVKKAVKRARENGRKTVKDCDV